MTSISGNSGLLQTPAPWFHALGEYADKITLPPGATDSPLAWVNNAREEVVRSWFPKEAFTDAVPDTVTLGKVLGILHAVLDWLEQPSPSELETKMEAALEKLPAAWRLTPKQFRKIERQWAKFFRQFRILIRKASDLAHTQGFAVARDFQRGYVVGIDLVPADLSDETQYSRNQKLLLLLSTLGPLAQSSPSVTQLHQTIAKAIGAPKAGDLKNFARISKGIGLKIRPAGRPRKIGTARMAPAHTPAR